MPPIRHLVRLLHFPFPFIKTFFVCAEWLASVFLFISNSHCTPTCSLPSQISLQRRSEFLCEQTLWLYWGRRGGGQQLAVYNWHAAGSCLTVLIVSSGVKHTCSQTQTTCSLPESRSDISPRLCVCVYSCDERLLPRTDWARPAAKLLTDTLAGFLWINPQSSGCRNKTANWSFRN